MALITEIIGIEDSNDSQIHLFREGLFLRAYQHSAYQFMTTVKSFRAIKKYYKVIDRDVVVLGFPSGRLSELFPNGSEITEADPGRHYVIERPPLDKKMYDIWFKTVQAPPPKSKKTPSQGSFRSFQGQGDQTDLFSEGASGSSEAAVSVVKSNFIEGRFSPASQMLNSSESLRAPLPDSLRTSLRELLRELQDFSIERSTPLDCMLFLSAVQAKLKDHGGL